MATMARREFLALAAATIGATSAEAREPEIPLGRGLRVEPGGQYFMPTHFGARLPGKASPRRLPARSFPDCAKPPCAGRSGMTVSRCW